MRTLPKVLKFLPSDKAKDARNFVNSLQYWLGGNAENLENLLVTIAQVRCLCTMPHAMHSCPGCVWQLEVDQTQQQRCISMIRWKAFRAISSQVSRLQ